MTNPNQGCLEYSGVFSGHLNLFRVPNFELSARVIGQAADIDNRRGSESQALAGTISGFRERNMATAPMRV